MDLEFDDTVTIFPNDATFPQCMDCHQKLKNQTSSIPICSESGSMYWTNQIRSSGISYCIYSSISSNVL